jgi:nitroreductase/FMN reductase [NAD(P)H]
MDLAALLRHRYGDALCVDPTTPGLEGLGLARLAELAAHRSVRAFSDRPLERPVVELLCAVALCSPTKSDLQQRDIVILDDRAQRRKITSLIPDMPWIDSAPAFLVFCGNNRRQRQLHEWRGRRFANDHLDPFFNAAVDAGIALQAFITAAEAVGLGTCPISVIRNHAQIVSDLLQLPDHVFPVAGLAVGWPAKEAEISLRLPLASTVHVDRFRDTTREMVDDYDRRRAAVQPYRRQRLADEYGTVPNYGWSEDKARQYSRPERADFGAFVRRKGFRLD